jgi:hypothetical protein
MMLPAGLDSYSRTITTIIIKDTAGRAPRPAPEK